MFVIILQMITIKWLTALDLSYKHLPLHTSPIWIIPMWQISSGFLMDYINPEILYLCDICPGGCNIETLLEPSGIITSPGYPDMDYPNEVD